MCRKSKRNQKRIFLLIISVNSVQNIKFYLLVKKIKFTDGMMLEYGTYSSVSEFPFHLPLRLRMRWFRVLYSLVCCFPLLFTAEV
jgi:hypothetical protein